MGISSGWLFPDYTLGGLFRFISWVVYSLLFHGCYSLEVIHWLCPGYLLGVIPVSLLVGVLPVTQRCTYCSVLLIPSGPAPCSVIKLIMLDSCHVRKCSALIFPFCTFTLFRGVYRWVFLFLSPENNPFSPGKQSREGIETRHRKHCCTRRAGI